MSKEKYLLINNEDDKRGILSIRKGQVMAGFTIGILMLDVWYPLLPGNVVNASTYNFPVLYHLVQGSSVDRLLGHDLTLRDEVLKAGRALQQQGVRAVTGACGYFAHFQTDLADDLDVPVYVSSLLQLPLILAGLRRNQKVGILCANKSLLTEEMLEKTGMHQPGRCAIAGLENGTEFSKLLGGKGCWDNDAMRLEVVTTAKNLVDHDQQIGAILLECSDLPPYAADIQKAVNLPVFDYISMINWIHQGVVQKPYYGVS